MTHGFHETRVFRRNVDKGAIEEALAIELLHENRWLPDEPVRSAAMQDTGAYADLLVRAVARGFPLRRRYELFARKPGFGLRPLTMTDLGFTTILRHLVANVVGDDFHLDRSHSAWLSFSWEPLNLAEQAFGVTIGDILKGDFKGVYVISADLSAFYDVVDHELLLDELMLASDGASDVEPLVSSLTSVMGKARGLPQFSAAADILSEVFVSRVERSLARHGFEFARYNDDFRVVAVSYQAALDALERLDRAVRDADMLLNDRKTKIEHVSRYLLSLLGLSEGDEIPEEFHDANVEQIQSEYVPLAEMELDEAKELLDSIVESIKEEDNLRELSFKRWRSVGQAMKVVGRDQSDELEKYIRRIQGFFPMATPDICSAIISAGPDFGLRTIDQVLPQASLNAWQQYWYAYSIGQLGGESSKERVAWLREQMSVGGDPAASAAAASALARYGEIGVAELEQLLVDLPSALHGYLFQAAATLSDSNTKARDWLTALGQTHPDSSLFNE
jgi:hypothetical protein